MSFVVFLSYPNVSYIWRLCFSRYSAKTFLLRTLQSLRRVLLCFIRRASKPSIATAWSRLFGQGPFLLALPPWRGAANWESAPEAARSTKNHDRDLNNVRPSL